MRLRQARIPLFVMVLSLLLALCGCHTIAQQDTSEPEPQTTSPVALPTEPILTEVVPKEISILLYHHITEEASPNSVSAFLFGEHMRALVQDGYTAVSFSQVIDFVRYGTELPEKPILITFDDGYESNLTLAAPILRQYGMKATVFVIGVSIGKDTYKDTGVPMIPHFSMDEAAEWSDVIWIESHGYDVHEVKGRDEAPIRRGVLPREGESEEAYTAFLTNDCDTMSALFLECFGRKPTVFAYPTGRYWDLSEKILKDQGFLVTLTTAPHSNLLTPGDESCLYLMGRYSISEENTPEDLLDMLSGGAQ